MGVSTSPSTGIFNILIPGSQRVRGAETTSCEDNGVEDSLKKRMRAQHRTQAPKYTSITLPCMYYIFKCDRNNNVKKTMVFIYAQNRFARVHVVSAYACCVDGPGPLSSCLDGNDVTTIYLTAWNRDTRRLEVELFEPF